MRAHRLNVTVAKDHQLQVHLPDDFPSGPAEVIILTADSETKSTVQLGGVLSPSGPPPVGDPIADTLAEFREERADLLAQRAKRYSAKAADSR